MADEVVRLVVEVDASKVGAAAAAMRGTFGAAVRGMDADSKRAQQSVEGIGFGADKAARLAARAMQGVSRGIGAVTAGIAAQERSWIGLGTSMLTAFAAGGGIGLGLAAIGAGVGLLIGREKEAGDAAAELRKRWDESFSAMTDKTKELALATVKAREETEALQALVAGGAKGTGDLAGQMLLQTAKRLDAEIKAKQTELHSLQGRDASGKPITTGFGIPLPLSELNDSFGGQEARLAEITRAEKERLELVAQRKEIEKQIGDFTAAKHATETLQHRKEAEETNRLLEDRLRILRAETELERDLVNVEIEARKAKEGGATPERVSELRGRLGADAWRKFLSAEDPDSRAAADAANAFADDLAKWEAKQQEITDAVENTVQGYSDAAAKARALTEEEAERVELERKIAELIEKGADLTEIERVAAAGLEAIDARRAARVRERVEAESKAAAEKARREAEAFAEARANATDDIRKEIDLANAATDERRAMVEIEQRIAEWRTKGVDEGLLGEYRAAALAKLNREDLEKQAQEFRQFVDGMKSTISGGLTDAIVDGITTGFSNGTSIATQLVDTLLRQVLQSIVTSGINAAFSALFGAIGGGGGGGGILSTIVGVATGGGGGGGGAPAAAIAGGAAACPG